MIFTKGRLQQGLRILLAVYLIITFYITVVSRATSGIDNIRTEWLEGYKSVHDVYANSEISLNILLFVPIGCLVGLVARKFRLIYTVLVGLFVSETIECSQLIWQRGTFDVNDLMNNTIGAMIGGLIAVAVINGAQRRPHSLRRCLRYFHQHHQPLLVLKKRLQP